jgi:uncharacterized protein
MRIWIDITNTPHVHVLLPLIRYLEKKHELIITARDFSETIPLLKKQNIKPIILGEYKGKNRLKKALGLISRLYKLYKQIPEFDLSLSLGGNYTATISRLRRKTSIVFSDNDISFKGAAYRFGNYFIFPSYFNFENLIRKYKISKNHIYSFNGFKEDIYIADFTPDPDFLKCLPFQDFITIRPENLKASYVPVNSKTIVPELFDCFRNENILFLPRYQEERKYAKNYPNIFIPDGPLSGLDVCYYTKAMLTGAGTFAREAALLGTPAVSFFPGSYLAVDEEMIKRRWEFRSRNPQQIFNYVLNAQKSPSRAANSVQVKNSVIGIIEEIISIKSIND